MKKVVTMRDLLEAGVHFGHNSRYWNPKMREYIYGTREKVHIINLEYTLSALRRAQSFVRGIAKNRNKLLFVGTKRAAKEQIELAARSIGQPYVCNRWLGGMLTNYKTIRMSIRRYNDLQIQFEDGTINKLTKKEILMLEREMFKLERSIGGIKDMGGLPDAVFVIDVDREYIAMNEITSLGIPIIALVDTNCNPDGIGYVIPGNDDSGKSIKLFVDAITEAYAEGLQEANELKPLEDAGPKITKSRKKVSLSLRKSEESPRKKDNGDIQELATETDTTQIEAETVATDVPETPSDATEQAAQVKPSEAVQGELPLTVNASDDSKTNNEEM